MASGGVESNSLVDGQSINVVIEQSAPDIIAVNCVLHGNVYRGVLISENRK